MKKYDAVIAGYMCVDLIPDFKKIGMQINLCDLLTPGKLVEIDKFHFVLGGLVPTTGLTMKKFKKEVFLNGLVGTDFIGKIALEWLNQYGLSAGITKTGRADTAFSIVIAPPGIERIYLESIGCNQIFDSSCINFEEISRSLMFHFGYPPLLKQFYINDGDQLVDLFSRVQKLGVVTSLDFSLPDNEGEAGKMNWPGIIERILPLTDIFIPSLDEILQIMNPDEYREVLSSGVSHDIINKVIINTIRKIGKHFIDSGVKILLIKAGKRGAYLLTGNVSELSRKLDFKINTSIWNNKEFWLKPYHIDEAKVVNVSGTGDMAPAAFLTAILEGESPVKALKYAVVASRNNLYCHNIYDDLPEWHSMTEDIMKEQNEIISF